MEIKSAKLSITVSGKEKIFFFFFFDSRYELCVGIWCTHTFHASVQALLQFVAAAVLPFYFNNGFNTRFISLNAFWAQKKLKHSLLPLQQRATHNLLIANAFFHIHTSFGASKITKFDFEKKNWRRTWNRIVTKWHEMNPKGHAHAKFQFNRHCCTLHGSFLVIFFILCN